MKLWKGFVAIFAGTLLVGVLVACGTASPTATPTEAAAVEEAAPAPVPAPVVAAPAQAPVESAAVAPGAPKLKPEPGGIWNTSGTPRFLDPYIIIGGAADRNVLNSLIQIKLPFDPAKGVEFEPYLASEWSTSEDGTKWRLKLRQGVTWHDGETFDADDVLATTQRVLDKDFQVEPRQVLIRNVFTGVKKIDAYTVEFDTGQFPNAQAFTFLNSHYFLMVPDHVIRGEDRTSSDVLKRWKRMGLNLKANEAGTLTIGTGPFKMVEWKLDDHTTFKRNPNYFKFDVDGQRLPYMDGIEYTSIADPTRRLAFFVAGQFDYSLGPGAGMTQRDATSLCKQTRDPECWNLRWPHGLGSVTVNHTSTPIFLDPKVKTAHRYGHDVSNPMDYGLAGGSAFIWVDRTSYPDSTISQKEQYELMPWSNPARRAEFDQKAKGLLAEAGYPNGVELPHPFYASGGGAALLCSGSFLDQSSRHADEINQIGFKTFLECRAGVVVQDELKSSRWSILHNYPPIAFADPATGIMQHGLLDSGLLLGATWTWPGVEESDAIYRRIQKTVDTAKSNELLKEYERWMTKPDLALFFGYQAQVVLAARGCVHNYRPGGVWNTQAWVESVWISGTCQK